MSKPEQEHIVGAFSFELGKCQSEEVKDRVLANLANVDAGLTGAVAANLGKPTPKGKPARGVVGSPALSIMPSAPAPVAGRVVGILAGDGVDSAGLLSLVKALTAAGAVAQVIAPHGGSLAGHGGTVAVDKSAMTTQSVEYDALVVAGGPGAAAVGADPYTALNLGEAYRHYKPIAAWGEGREILEACAIAADAEGVVTGASANRAFANDLIAAIGWHRHWARALPQ
jgi:catalase